MSTRGYRPAPTLQVAKSEAQLGSFDDAIETRAALGVPDEVRPASVEEVRARSDAGFLGGAVPAGIRRRPSRTALARAAGGRASGGSSPLRADAGAPPHG